MTKRALVKNESIKLIAFIQSKFAKTENIDVEKVIDKLEYLLLYFDIKKNKEILIFTEYNSARFMVEIDSDDVVKVIKV